MFSSGRVARKLGLLETLSDDWKAAVELTGNLRRFDPNDPVKYDFALFGLVFQRSFKTHQVFYRLKGC
ncbi:MAG: DUF2400 family protein [Bacteroidales bacterium]